MMNTGIMADLNPSGTVLSYDQIIADRIRKGYCDTCRPDPYPVRCFEIKKRMGGTFTKKIPITKPGKVFDGICLRCNPLKDPDRPSKDKGHHRRQGSHDSNGNNSHHRRQGSYDSNNSKVNHLRQDSYDSYVNSHHRRQDSHDSNQHRRQGSHDSNGNNSHHRRQGSYDSNNAKVNHLRQDSYDSYINFHHRRQDSHDSDSNHGRHRRQGSYDSYINFHHRRQDSYDSNHRRHRRQGSYEYQQQHSNEYAQDHPLSLGVAVDRGHRRQGSRDDKYYTQQQQQATAHPVSPGGRDRRNQQPPISPGGRDRRNLDIDQDRKSVSERNVGSGSRKMKPMRSHGFINLAASMPDSLEDADDYDDNLREFEAEYNRDDLNNRDDYTSGQYNSKQPPQQHAHKRDGHIGGGYNRKDPPEEQAPREQQKEGDRRNFHRGGDNALKSSSPTRGRSGRSFGNRKQLMPPLRQGGFIDLAESLPDSVEHATDYGDNLHPSRRDHNREDYNGGQHNSKQPPQHEKKRDGYIGGGYNRKQPPKEEQQEEDEYIEKVTYNIFGDPVVEKIRKKPESKQRSRRQHRVRDDSPSSSPGRHNREHNVHGYLNNNNNNKGGGGSPNPHPYNRDRQHRDNSPHNSFRALMEDEKLPAIPDLAPLGGNATNEGAGRKTEEEPMDALAMLCAQHIAKNPQETVRFVPNTGTLLPNSELALEDMSDEMSVMTLDTYFRDRRTTLTAAGKQQSIRRTGMTAVSERSSGSNSSGLQKSMVSHQIKEPELGFPRASKPPPEQAAAAAAASGANDEGEATDAASSNASSSQQDLESYLESSPPHLLTLREMVGQCTQAGADTAAIDVVTQALIIDNATSVSKDLALFCLTTMWVLARKSDVNKHKILFEDSTFESIIEAMHIYRENAEIQTRACGVLWSLSMDPNDRKHVAQKEGCEAILNAMQVHNENETLQIMALGALKVLSFDNISKSTLRTFGALAIVSGIMGRHVVNPTIQSEGCVILGNLAVDDANQFVAPVTENEVEAIVRGILAHPDSLEVHEAACFTLMSLASSAANVELIRNNEMSTVSLEMAFQKHPDDVGVNILTLWKRLKFDSLK